MRIKFAIALLVICVVCASTKAQDSLQQIPLGIPGEEFDKRINTEISVALMKKDLTRYADELVSENPRTFKEVMRRIYVFERAGQTERAKRIASKIFEVDDYKENYDFALDAFSVHFDEKDVDGIRAYVNAYFARKYGYTPYSFLKIWGKVAGAGEIENWLLERYNQSPEELKNYALNDLYEWRVKNGDAEAICEMLKSDFTKGATNVEKAENYLKFCYDVQSAKWLAENFVSTNAYDYYKLGKTIQELPRKYSYKNRVKDYEELWRTSISLYQRSLEIDYSDYDKDKMDSREFVNNSMDDNRGLRSVANEDYEKQLRYWTKNQIVAAHNDLKQPELSQQTAQELAETEKDDIVANFEYFNEKKPAQPSAANIELKMLQDESTKRESLDYWKKRINYYLGIKNFSAVEQSFTRAFDALQPRKSQTNGNNERLGLIYFLMFHVDEICHGKTDECEFVTGFLETEFSAAYSETDYLNSFLDAICNGISSSLIEKWIAEKPKMLTRLFAFNQDLSSYRFTNRAFKTYAENNQTSFVQKQKMWDELEEIANKNDYSLTEYANAMTEIGEYERAIRLYKKVLSHSSNKEDAKTGLLNAYLKKGDWRNAEKLLFNETKTDADENSFFRYEFLQQHLEQIALIAVQQSAMKDALRLWKIRANLDRRKIDFLSQLRETKLKEPLRQFYLEMKKRDSQSDVPDKALERLQ